MAAYTINENDKGEAVRYLEAIAYTNEGTDVSKAVKVPGWAKYLSLYLYIDSGGTSPTVDLSLWVPDFSTDALFKAPSDDIEAKLADFAGITQITGTDPYLQTIDIGPGITGIADDATGAASADARMAINTILPPWLVYKLAFDIADTDEDYALQLVAQFRA
jgi:hypothetical protein